jgi:hypothetical protein
VWAQLRATADDDYHLDTVEHGVLQAVWCHEWHQNADWLWLDAQIVVARKITFYRQLFGDVTGRESLREMWLGKPIRQRF